MGPVILVAYYGLLYYHLIAYFEVILPVLARKLGLYLGLCWVGLGLCILYNICFNHSLAVIVKSGSPMDLEVSC